MTLEELKNEVYTAMEDKPQNWRKGQFVFNYIDAKYGVARAVQFEDRTDCFFIDENIYPFLVKCWQRIERNAQKGTN